MTAADARSHLVQLEAERALAQVKGLGGVQAFMTDLEDEIDEWRRRYIGAALSEFASLRHVAHPSGDCAQPNVRPAVSAPSMM
jgi:hypothetical protein